MKSIQSIKKLVLIALFAVLFALVAHILTTFAAATPTTPPGCGSIKTMEDVGNSKMFPIIPLKINDSAACSAPFWTLDIIAGLIYKLIRLLNWLAVSFATLAVVYSGFMYILGYANEENVKKSKNILKAAITGLIIVVCAKWIVYGTLLMFSDDKTGGSGAQIQIFLP